MLGKLASLYLEGPCASLLCVVDEVFNVGILELRPIITSNSLDLDIKLILGSSCKLLEDALHFTLFTQK